MHIQVPPIWELQTSIIVTPSCRLSRPWALEQGGTASPSPGPAESPTLPPDLGLLGTVERDADEEVGSATLSLAQHTDTHTHILPPLSATDFFF